MKLLGFNFTKIRAERLEGSPGGIKIVPNVMIKELKSVKADLIKTKEEFIGVKFSYIVDYEKDYAKIEFSGDLLVSVEPKLAKEILKDWKDKKLNLNLRVFIFNIILRKSNIKAIELEDELGLPLHVQLPSVTLESFRGAETDEEKTPKKD